MTHGVAFGMVEDLFARAVAGSDDVDEHFESLLDMLGGGPATVALGRLRLERPLTLAGSRLLHFPADNLTNAALAAADAALDHVSALFGSAPIALVVPAPPEASLRPFSVRIVDGAGCVFVPPGTHDLAVWRHELGHLMCASGHPLFDEGVATWCEAPEHASRATEVAPCSLDEAAAMGDDATLACFSGAEQAAFRLCSARIIAGIAQAGADVLVAEARKLRTVAAGRPLRDALAAVLGEGLEQAWRGHTLLVAPHPVRDGVALAFIAHDVDLLKDGARLLPEDRSYAHFLAGAIELFRAPQFDSDGLRFARLNAEWRSLIGQSTDWSGPRAALARFYAALEQAIADQESWWDVQSAFDDMMAHHADTAEVAAAAILYLSKQPDAGPMEVSHANELARRWADDPNFGPAFERLIADAGFASNRTGLGARG
jgi:hypothetical protein